MIRKLGLALVICALVAVVVWLPREDEIGAVVEPLSTGEPPAVGLAAVRHPAVPPFAERWELSYPEFGPAKQTFVLEVGAWSGKAATGRMSGISSADAAPFFDRLGFVLGADTVPEPTTTEVQLELVGDELSYGPVEIGATVLAGAFTATPPGEWRAYRVAIGGDAGPQYFLGVSDRLRAARLLPCVIADGPAIVASFRSLLRPAPKPRES
jgi:hypothetical protein